MQGARSFARSNTKLGNSFALQNKAMQSCRAALSAELPQFFTVHEAIVEHCPQCPAAVASQSHKQALHSALACFAWSAIKHCEFDMGSSTSAGASRCWAGAESSA
jgi:hypothetical protein